MPRTPLIKRPPSHRHAAGFTLLEWLTAMSISVILLTAALPSFQRWIDGQRLEGTARQLAADLQWARHEAVTRGEPIRVSLLTPGPTTSTACYVVHAGSPNDCHCPATGAAQCEPSAQLLRAAHLPAAEGLRLSATSATVLFDPQHGTASPAASFLIEQGQGRSVRHVLNLMGRLRSCSPNASVPGYPRC